MTEARSLIAHRWDFALLTDVLMLRLFAYWGSPQVKEKNLHFQPIQYASQDMNEDSNSFTLRQKRNYLPLVYAFEKFILSCMSKRYCILTISASNVFPLWQEDVKARPLRWILLLQEFDIENSRKKDFPDCEDSRACSIHKSFTSSASFWESSIQI
ncbi:hypothetical protein Tco_0860492 [Tanacetum coccineum]|uniref:Maturase K n=1 Tax=Tanacetum coccineum TaxID=301880 RepID=A0ABQ5BF34_9ASTR